MLTKRPENFGQFLPDDWDAGYQNVCLMVTVENQEFAERRIPTLLNTPASRRALSVEPMIGPVSLTPWIEQLDWVIAGGESLTGARPMNPNWIRELRDDCQTSGVPFFFKQWGWWTPSPVENASDRHEFDDGETVFYRGNKKANGAELDGEMHRRHPFRERAKAAERRLAVSDASIDWASVPVA